MTAATDKSPWKARPERAAYDEMRARLVSAAAVLLTETGLGRLRLDGVARRAGCARSSV